ncbi:MAG: DUF1553 domain-containing protein, partial [Planctomycetia bacterium]|nr:DUF1553 domain-containing protein [Planctomycetia bacterium]
WDDEPADRQLAKYDVLDGIVSTTGQVVLGMTVGCARCNDHKKDPIPQRDYYRMLAFFRDVSDMNPKNTRMFASDEHRQIQARLVEAKNKRESELHEQLAKIEEQFVAAVEASHGIKTPLRRQSDLVELRYREYRDTWERLPDFDSLKAETSGDLPRNFLTLSAATRSQAIGLVFEGQLRVPQAGEYSFSYDATEGLRVVIAGKKVIDHPGRGRHQGTERVALTAGLAPVRVEYFNSDSKPALSLSWAGPGIETRSLTDTLAAGESAGLIVDSRKEAQEWSYTTSAPAGGWSNHSFDDSQWQHGPGGFGTAGTPGAVVRTRWNTKDIWLRKAFRVERVPERISIDLHHDDEIEIFLNGRLVYEKQGYLVAYQRIMLPPEAAQALVAGDNVLAVHCHQTTGGQYVDVGLAPTTDREIIRALLLEQADQVLAAGTSAKYKSLVDQLEASRNRQATELGTEIMCVTERGREKTHVLIRGNPGAPGDAVEPGFPLVLTSAAPVIQERTSGLEPTSGKRRALAEWLTSPENPVTPRVMANRIWQFHFGRGIVPTPNDFGKLGEAPTHPELLDWLAGEFVRRGWRMKEMHKLLMLSNAYRMSSRASEAGLERDPANRLFWRFNMRRLAAEEVRDSILVVSGTLNLKSGGPGVFPPIPKAVLAGQSVPGQGWGNSPPDEASRRSVYVHVKRSLLVPILSQHDVADTDSSCAARFTTTVPTQALGMLNGEFTNEQARKLAERLEKDADSLLGQIARGIRLTTSRQPSDKEVKADVEFVKTLQSNSGMNAHQALVQYCLLLLNANEFVYLD